MSDLTLSGSIPGLLRRGSPVVVVHRGRRRTIVTWPPTGVLVGVALPEIGGASIPPNDVALDLTDATGRAHAAWWVLRQCYAGGWPDLHTGGRLWIDPAMYVGNPVGHDWDRRKLWGILLNAGRIHDWISHLDSDDPRLLDDGSRWVDAMALKLVVEHVATL